MRFECRPLEFYKRDGRTLTGYGVEWTEPRLFREWLNEFIGKLLLVAAFSLFWSAIVFGLQFGERAFVPLAFSAFVCLGLGLFLIRSSVNTRGQARSLEFYKDGRIHASWDGLWQIGVSDIRSVEAEQLKPTKTHEPQAYTHGVRMITRRGRVLHVAKDIAPDDAITVAVMLTEAIEAVKYADQRPAPARMNGMAAEVW